MKQTEQGTINQIERKLPYLYLPPNTSIRACTLRTRIEYLRQSFGTGQARAPLLP